MSQRKGPTRIPLFGSRIPIPGQLSSEPIRITTNTSSNPPQEITHKCIGKPVLFSEKEGILRYIGNVHFSDGVWCGIEFPDACGKNNGCVRGVRYFACPDLCGLMAPISKVILSKNIECQNEEDIVSGPHSMLFGVKDLPVGKSNIQNTVIPEESAKRKREENLPSNKLLIRSDTYDKLRSTQQNSISVAPKIFIQTATLTKESTLNSLYNTGAVNSRFHLNKNNFPDIINSTKIPPTFENCSETCFESDTNITILYRPKGTNTIAPNASAVTLNKLHESKVYQKSVVSESFGTLDNLEEQNKKTFIITQSTTDSLHSNHSGSPNFTHSNISECTVTPGLKEKVPNVRMSTDSLGSSFIHTPNWHSTPLRPLDIESSSNKRIRPTSFYSSIEDAVPKRDSLEYEESLGILTPEQMVDEISFAASRTPSLENIGSLPEDLQHLISKFQCGSKSPLDLPSPNLVDASTKDISLGLIDDRILSNFTLISDTTMNLELPLDSIDNRLDNYSNVRLEQTPSPEDLPLDPAPSIELESKTEPTKSKTASSFINSITSITSLDTGYQGDGEMSRPGSRGPDHSPLTRRPLIRPQPRRPEPMTDSDFYTESDVDIIEEHPIRGDRRARVIDGTLYGVDAQTAAEIYVNNRENMDSSGIFTDIEGNTASGADNEMLDASPSPSDVSTKTISNDSQNHAHVVHRASVKQDLPITKCTENNIELPAKRKSTTPTSAGSTPASVRSPKHVVSQEVVIKKYKIPKRNVVSKVKEILQSNSVSSNKEANRTLNKKLPGRWDAVMNKISKNQPEKSNLKDVKSKVFSSGLAVNLNAQQKSQNLRMRRPRPRGEISTNKTGAIGSLNSSASDLSAASPAKRIGSTKKRADVVRVTQVLTAAQLSPRTVHKNNVLAENKKNVAIAVTTSDNKFAPKKNTLANREKKSTPPITKDCGRATVKGGRVSPGARPPQQNRVPVVPLPRTIEALTVLLQHLVFNLDAFQTPYLKKQLEKSRHATENSQLAYRQLEKSFELFRVDHQNALDDERKKYAEEVENLTKQHSSNIAIVSEQHSKSMNSLFIEHQQLEQSHKDQLVKLRAEFTKLQNNHEQALEILREENDSIREEIDEKDLLIRKLEMFKQESEKLAKDYEAKEFKYKENMSSLTDEISRIKEENLRLLSYASDGKENKLQIVLSEVESLRSVLELKQNEVAELRKALVQSSQKADMLPSTVEKVSTLTARCEDLQSQLEQKTLYESQLIMENKKLQISLKEEFNHSNRLLQHNEELQWKLCQNKEVVNRVLEQAEETALSRSIVTSSFYERSSTPKPVERVSSFRERSLTNRLPNTPESFNNLKKSKNSYDIDSEEISPPSSPKVKGVVEKSDSVSYVLEMEESPEIIANRIVRRSFRNTTPPKSSSIKSPVNKRPRVKVTPISLSASASSITSPVLKINEHPRIRSISVQNSDNEMSSSHSDDVFCWEVSASSTPTHFYQYRNEKLSTDLDFNDDDDIKLPTLPSEIGRNDAESLPVPPHLARDIPIFESNSDDESSASSSSGQL